MSTNITRYETIGKILGEHKVRIVDKTGFEDGISATRMLFNRFIFDEE